VTKAFSAPTPPIRKRLRADLDFDAAKSVRAISKTHHRKRAGGGGAGSLGRWAASMQQEEEAALKAGAVHLNCAICGISGRTRGR